MSKRPPEPTGRNAIRTADPVLRELFAVMHRRRITMKSLAPRIGRSAVALSHYKKGTTTPSMLDVIAIADELGYELVLKPRE